MGGRLKFLMPFGELVVQTWCQRIVTFERLWKSLWNSCGKLRESMQLDLTSIEIFIKLRLHIFLCTWCPTSCKTWAFFLQSLFDCFQVATSFELYFECVKKILQNFDCVSRDYMTSTRNFSKFLWNFFHLIKCLRCHWRTGNPNLTCLRFETPKLL